MLLLDSDEDIDVLHGQAAGAAFVRSHFSEPMAISIVTYGEVYEGISRDSRRRYSSSVPSGGLLMGLLERLFGLKPSAKYVIKLADQKSERFRMDSATHYQPNITDVSKGRLRDVVAARLVRESKNKHDENAVRIEIDRRHVGYINAGSAKYWAPLLDDAETREAAVECYVDFKREYKGGPIMVYLRASPWELEKALRELPDDEEKTPEES